MSNRDQWLDEEVSWRRHLIETALTSTLDLQIDLGSFGVLAVVEAVDSTLLSLPPGVGDRVRTRREWLEKDAEL